MAAGACLRVRAPAVKAELCQVHNRSRVLCGRPCCFDLGNGEPLYQTHLTPPETLCAVRLCCSHSYPLESALLEDQLRKSCKLCKVFVFAGGLGGAGRACVGGGGVARGSRGRGAGGRLAGCPCGPAGRAAARRRSLCGAALLGAGKPFASTLLEVCSAPCSNLSAFASLLWLSRMPPGRRALCGGAVLGAGTHLLKPWTLESCRSCSWIPCQAQLLHFPIVPTKTDIMPANESGTVSYMMFDRVFSTLGGLHSRQGRCSLLLARRRAALIRRVLPRRLA